MTPSRRQKTVLHVIVLATAFALAGCATREKLAPADTSEQITLASQVSYKTTAINGFKWEYIALPGIYAAERMDTDGVYFYGAGRSIVEIGELYRNVPRLKVGGMYIPNEKSRPVQFVFAFENTPTTIDDINKYTLDRTVATTALPAATPGVSAGANILGNAVGGAVVGAILVAGEGEITRVTIKDQATSDLIRSARTQIPPDTASQASPAQVEKHRH